MTKSNPVPPTSDSVKKNSEANKNTSTNMPKSTVRPQLRSINEDTQQKNEVFRGNSIRVGDSISVNSRED